MIVIAVLLEFGLWWYGKRRLIDANLSPALLHAETDEVYVVWAVQDAVQTFASQSVVTFSDLR